MVVSFIAFQTYLQVRLDGDVIHGAGNAVALDNGIDLTGCNDSSDLEIIAVGAASGA